MSVTLGVVMDPIERISFKKDTTLALLLAARRRGWALRYMELDDLYVRDGGARARTRDLEVFDDPQHWHEFGDTRDQDLGELDVILMRKDPPVDDAFTMATWILEMAEGQGALVLNPPHTLRDCNEKLFATRFPQCIPPLVVSRDPEKLREFHSEHGDVIMKPMDGMGGKSIFRVRPDDENLSVILETLTEEGTRTAMAQRYLPEIRDGDKRILMIDGEPLPYSLARIPGAGESRGNLAAGGRGEGRELTARDRWICEQVGPALKARGLLFVGIDVIGDYLTEVNVTSPTCVRELDRAFDDDIGGRLMEAIAARLDSRSGR